MKGLPSGRKPPGGQTAGTWPELIDKYIQLLVSDSGIHFAMVLVVVGLILYQDNKAGQLKSWNDLLWTMQKCLVPIALYLIFLLYRFAYRQIKKQPGQTSRR